jgi:hypothetical protein
MFPRRLWRRAPAGAGSYPSHLLSDFIDVRASAIFDLYTSSSPPQVVGTSTTEWNIVFQPFAIRWKSISGVSVSVLPSIRSII